MALRNHRPAQVSGGNDRIARPLKAASVTTIAGSSRKPRMAMTVSVRNRRKSLPDGRRVISEWSYSLERLHCGAHQRQHSECQREAGDREACRKRKIEARKTEL